MGSLQAQEMAEMMSIDDALAWHLTSNHYPPVPVSMVQACKEAIQAGLEYDWFRMIELPEGVSYKGSKLAPADEIISSYNLDTWLELDEEGLE